MSIDLLIFTRDHDGRPCAVIHTDGPPTYYRMSKRQVAMRMLELAELMVECERGEK